MKRALLVLSLALFGLGIGCSPTATDPFHLDNEIRTKFPGATFTRIPDRRYSVIVKLPNGEIWWVEQNSMSGPQITNQVMILK